jgi:CheY-like chemotaxis protein
MLVDLLSEHHLGVSVARSGAQAYQLAQATPPDLILLDVHLPDMDGYACCRLLQANPATHAIPIMFVSAAASSAERVMGLMAGAVDYIAKPFDRDELMARVAVQLRRSGRGGPVLPPAHEPGDFDAVLLNAARRLISENLGNLPELSELARRVGTYRERLGQVFRTRLGVSVFAYVRALRLERASALLRDTALDVRDIAQLVGFQNAGSFTTAFRETTGSTPTAFRARLRQQGRTAEPAAPGAG